MREETVFGIPRKHLILIVIVLLFEIALLTFATWQWGVMHLDSDDSAEMILAELLSRTGGIISKNWYYSTELRVLNTQLVMTPLFHVFSDWQMVRTAGTAVLMLIYICSYLLFCRSVQTGSILIYFSPIILWPFSEIYQDIVLFGLYYIPHLCFIFLILALVLFAEKTRNAVRIVLLIAVSFSAGLGGIRMVVICAVPLLFAAILSVIPLFRTKREKDFKVVARSILAAAVCITGYFFNIMVLAKKYSFATFTDVHFMAPQAERFKTIIKDTLKVMGVGKLKGFSFSSILSILTMGMIVLLIYMSVRLILNWKSLSQEEQILLLVFICSFAFTVGSGLFLISYWGNRYMIMPCMGYLIVLAVYSKRIASPRAHILAICMFIIALQFLSGIRQYCSFATVKKHQKQDAALQYIIDSGMTFGFGDWDCSDILTELTDGRIHMCKLNNYKLPDAWYWLMEKDFRKYAENTAVFLIMDNARLDYNGKVSHLYGEWKREDLKYLDEGTIGFQDENYTVWQYDSLDSFEKIVGKTF